MTLSTKKKIYIDIAIIALITALIVALSVKSKSFWGDEVWSINAVKHDYAKTIVDIADDIHPPLYFLLLKTWSLIWGASESSLRIFQGLQGFSLLFVCLLLFRKLFPRYHYHPLWVVLAASSELWLFLPMLRYYILASAIVMISTYYYLSWLDDNSRRNEIILTFLYVLLLYTDYPSSVIILYQFIFTALFHKKLIKRHFIIAVISSIFFAPWALITVRQISFLTHWTQYADLNASPWVFFIKIIFGMYAFVFGETVFPLDILVISALIALVIVAVNVRWGQMYYERKRTVIFVSGAILSGLCFTSFITGYIATHHSFIYTPSRTFFALPFVFLAWGVIFEHLKTRRMKYLLLLALFSINAYGDYNWYLNKNFLNPVYAVPWKEVLGDMAGQEGVVLADESICYEYYVNQDKNNTYPRLFRPASFADFVQQMNSGQIRDAKSIFVIAQGRDSTVSEIPSGINDYLRSHKKLAFEKKYAFLNKKYVNIKEKILKRKSYDAKLSLTRYDMK